MVSSGRDTIISLLLLLGAIISANAQPATDKTSNSSISGKVTIGDKGVSGMVVALANAIPSASINITGFKAITDAEGNYQIKNVPPDSYQVLVSAPAYVQSERTSIVIGKNEVIENIDIALVRGGVITGKVVDADGRPVVEEEIFLSSITPTRGLPFLRTNRTDDRGVYRAFGLPAGRYKVSAGKDSISSFLRTTTGHVRTYHPNTVNASDATVISVNEGSETTNVDIVLGSQVSKYVARGRIIDVETSQPLPNAKIGIQLFFTLQANAGSGSTSINNAAESTKTGEFKIENLPPGKYAVYLDAPDSESFSEQVRFEVTDQDIEGLLIKVSKGASVSGLLVLEGTDDPALRANLAQNRVAVSVSNDPFRRMIPNANVNRDGSFRFTGLPSGRLTLNLPDNRDKLRVLRIERDGVVYPGGIEIREREQITGLRVVVSQANGKIRGALKLPEDLQLPATGRLRVWVRRTEGPTGFNTAVEADARGRFLIDGLVPGTYEFNVDLLGVTSGGLLRIQRPTQTVIVTNGAIADVTITLQTLKTDPGGP